MACLRKKMRGDFLASYGSWSWEGTFFRSWNVVTLLARYSAILHWGALASPNYHMNSFINCWWFGPGGPTVPGVLGKILGNKKLPPQELAWDVFHIEHFGIFQCHVSLRFRYFKLTRPVHDGNLQGSSTLPLQFVQLQVPSLPGRVWKSTQTSFSKGSFWGKLCYPDIFHWVARLARK